MPQVRFDFSALGAVSPWFAIDDRVMGGVPHSRLRHDPAGHVVFEGEVWLDRNGGFAFVRSALGDHGLPGAQACLLDLCCNGPSFKLSLLTDDGLDSLNHQAGIAPSAAGGRTLRLPPSDFRASFRGREVPRAPPLDPARIRQVGPLISARQAGAFALRIRRITLV